MKDLVKGFVMAIAIASGLWGLSITYPNQNTAVQAGNATKSMILTQQDNGMTLNLKVGDRFSIQLPENPTTGFQWAINPNQDGLLTLQKTSYIPASPQLIGSGGQKIWEFKVKKAGKTNLSLKYWRPWEGDSSIVDRYSVTVQAES